MSLPGTLYINGSCRITNGQAWVGDSIVFQQKATAPPVFLPALYAARDLNYPKWYKMDRLSQLGILAADLIYSNSSKSSKPDPLETAIVLANRHSSLETDARFADQLEGIPSPAVFVYTLPNIVMGEISIKYGLKGEQAFFLMEKPDPGFLLRYAETFFAEGQVKNCLVGWLDLFQDDYLAVLFLVSKTPSDNKERKLNTENFYQYLHHEQGAVN